MKSHDIHKAATENNLRELKILDPELLNAKNHEGKTPLLLAIENGNSEFVQRLIRQGADVQLGDNNGVTPAHLASYYCDTSSFTHIVADLRKCQEILNAKDNYGHDFLDYLSAKRIDGYKDAEEKCNPKVKKKVRELSSEERKSSKEYGSIISYDPTFDTRVEAIMNFYLRFDEGDKIEKANKFVEALNGDRSNCFVDLTKKVGEGKEETISKAASEDSSIVGRIGSFFTRNTQNIPSGDNQANRKRADSFPEYKEKPSTTSKPRGRRHSFYHPFSSHKVSPTSSMEQG